MVVEQHPDQSIMGNRWTDIRIDRQKQVGLMRQLFRRLSMSIHLLDRSMEDQLPEEGARGWCSRSATGGGGGAGSAADSH